KGSEMKKEFDPVNRPRHYVSHPSGVECITVVRWMNFNLGNAVKYIWRAGLKEASPQIEDLKKARWYLDDEIRRLENEQNRQGTSMDEATPRRSKRARG